MTLNKFNLPDVGEGLTEAEIVAWKVKPGDTVAINDVLCEIETAKSLVELPSPFAGTVTELLVPEGITVEVGTAIISVSDAVSGDPTPADVPAPAVPAAAPVDAPMYGKLPADDGASPAPAVGPADDSDRPAAGPLVGSGPKADAVKRRPRKASAPAAAGFDRLNHRRGGRACPEPARRGRWPGTRRPRPAGPARRPVLSRTPGPSGPRWATPSAD